ncbi:GNAT family N-acetyltransferase [Salinibacterium sp. M195]|uniref:GNAT family N-acetyltransferase n=1 Tax=Salinibacterium sp. M195 TaxID=2583374 RepID=UPI001C6283A0|nr:GNAT family N-acetyltransferase [Salinibacterium sp. M195]QYH35025.1 GNAT family N-acetyltransferase [Salinibacterium sp. M195]
MTFALRAPQLADAPALAELHVSAWRETYSHLLPGDFFSAEYVEGRHRMWNRILTDPRTDVSIRVAESGGEITGFACAGNGMRSKGEEELPRDRQLYAIYLAASHYGTGAGQSLLDEVLGDTPAMLWVAKANPRAVAFYRRNGFEFDGAEQSDPAAPKIVDARMVR